MLLGAEWRRSETGTFAKFYRLTAGGRNELGMSGNADGSRPQHLRYRSESVLVALAVGAGAQVAPGAVHVCVNESASVPHLERMQAQGEATAIFARIGVELDWRCGQSPSASSVPIVVELADGTPSRLLPGALGFARPYEGIHIRVFYDRIRTSPRPVDLLAYVLAHEIGHILTRSDSHSNSGVMKAYWTRADMNAIFSRTLHFAPEDAVRISGALRGRDSSASNQAAATFQTAVSQGQVLN